MTAVYRPLLLIVFLTCGLAWPLHAQEQEFQFEHITVEQGLSQSSILRVFQDHQGFLWFGTGDGLNKYDGYDFTVYKHDPDDANSLAGNVITALYEAPSDPGVLWVGMEGNGVTRFDHRKGTYTQYRHDPDSSNTLRSDNVFAFYEDRYGTLWLGTQEGLQSLDRETGTFTLYEHELENPQSLSDNGITSIYEDRAGRLWIGTWKGGLNRFDRETNAFAHYRHNPDDPYSLGGNLVSSIFEDGQGTLWIGTAGGGLHRFDPGTDTFIRYRHDPDDPNSLSSNYITSIGEIATEPGVLWVGTSNKGLDRFDSATGTVTHYGHDPFQENGISGNTITAVLGDRSGVLWIGTNLGGIHRSNDATGTFAHYKHDPNDPNSLNQNVIWALYEDRDGMLWVGTNGGGLNRVDRRQGAITHFLHDPDDPASVSHNWIRSILEDRDGVLWVGSHGGLDRLDRDRGAFTSYARNNAFPEISRNDAPIAMLEDHEGMLWIGMGMSGLIRLDRAADTFTHFVYDEADPYSLGSNSITALYEAGDHTLWVGTRGGGLHTFDRENETFTRYQNEPGNANSLSHNTVLTIHEDADGLLWIGTSGGGLNCFHPGTEAFVRFTEQTSDLPTNTVLGILEDDDGHLWISTHDGISRLDPQTATFRNYGVERGLQSREFNFGAYHKSSRGELFFGGINGFNAFFPDQIRDNPNPPQVVFTDFKLRNESVELGAESPLEEHISSASSITLSHAENDLAFDYVGLHYATPEHNTYAYMLEGFDADWRWVGEQRNAIYTNIPPGPYVFKVKAANSDGVWTEEGASIRLTVRPPWWKTYWAYAFYILGLIGVVVAADRIQRQRVVGQERARAEIREAQLQAQAAEAQALLLRTENERQMQELEEARQLQLSMLPRAVPQHPVVEIAAYMKTATEVGGDYYDFNVADDGTLTVAIGDATGHGANAGTMVTATKSIFNVLAAEPDLIAVLEQSTRALKQMGLRKLYMALALAKLNDHTLELAGAGMPPALIYRGASQHVEEISLKGMPLGSFVDFPYQKAALQLAPGDTVILMSDGFPEMFDMDGEMFGYDRTKAVFEEVAHRSPDEIVMHFAEAGKTWANGSARDDDMTFIVMKVKHVK